MLDASGLRDHVSNMLGPHFTSNGFYLWKEISKVIYKSGFSVISVDSQHIALYLSTNAY